MFAKPTVEADRWDNCLRPADHTAEQVSTGQSRARQGAGPSDAFFRSRNQPH